ncbi:tetratricopeptide repeat-containing sensor histidine kinase [Winogradskyella schleiferi]|uniref:tetratricopeptide repeat-containing sensor histidine kinase n=1 Tax=Winogradskyella schleiferi TaxID=2686078 RepID=UPI0015B82BFE|nr:tetratricopeptide repeat-containing sensor histidine kinase [Winogradskyella schleiferi]
MSKANKFFHSSYEKAMSQKNFPMALNDLYYITSINYKNGAYDASEASAVKALELLDNHTNIPNTDKLRKSFNTLLGILYSEQKHTVKSLELYAQVLKTGHTAKDSAIIYNNISNVYKDQNDLKSAKISLFKAYDMLPRINDKHTIALILNNLGYVESKLGNTSGLSLMNEALELRSSLKDTSALYTSYSSIAQYYYDVDSLELSKENALKALNIAEALNSAAYKEDALALLTSLSDDAYASEYKRLNDSLITVEKERLNAFALLKYDTDKLERKAVESKLESEKQSSRAILAFSLVVFIVLVSLFLYFYLRAKHKREKLQEVYETESRISKLIHDEVANDVYQFLTRLEAESLTNPILIDDLHDIYSKTRDISKEHSLLDDDAPYIQIIQDLVSSYSDKKTSVIAKGSTTIDWEMFPTLKKHTLYKVIQELLINMKKHSNASVAVIQFKHEGKNIVISYSDNGVGCDLKKSTGLQNVENRIQSIQGKIIFESEKEKGFKAKIVI